MSLKTQALRDLVVERLVVAADEIFVLFEQIFAEYKEVLTSKILQDHKYHIQRDSREEPQNEDFQTVVVQSEVDLNLGCIKNEEEEIPLNLQFPSLTAKSKININKSTFFQPEPPLNFQFIPLTIKSEDNVNKSVSFEQEPAEEHAQDYEGEEPGCSLDLDEEFTPCSYPDTNDSEDWEPSPKKKRKSRNKKIGLGRQNMTNIRNQPSTGPKVKAFSCSVCKNNFSEKHYLNEHMRVHTGEKPFRCEPCGLSFTFRQNYYQHDLAVHRKEKPHRCRVCNKDFADKSELISHKETHKDEKPFKCLNCNKTFTCIKGLMSHKMSQRCL